jgi:hypothetical protein
MLKQIESIPVGVGMEQKQDRVILEGEITGHAHRLDGPGGQILVSDDGMMVVVILSPVGLIHEEHDRIELSVGLYEVVRQREYNPFEDAIRNVQD